MKPLHYSLLLGLCATAFVGAEPESPAGPPKPEGGRNPEHKHFIEAWRKADTDGDGLISPAEFAQMERLASLPAEKRDAIFKRLDKDGSCTLSRPELMRMLQGVEDRRHMGFPRLQELDTDKSGGVSFEEFAAGDMLKKLPPERREAMFRRLDADGDGQITPKDRPQDGGGEPHVLFRRLDKDGDGRLSFEEFRQAPMWRHLDEAGCKGRFDKADANQDRFLDLREFGSQFPHRQGGRPQPGPRPEAKPGPPRG